MSSPTLLVGSFANHVDFCLTFTHLFGLVQLCSTDLNIELFVFQHGKIFVLTSANWSTSIRIKYTFELHRNNYVSAKLICRQVAGLERIGYFRRYCNLITVQSAVFVIIRKFERWRLEAWDCLGCVHTNQKPPQERQINCSKFSFIKGGFYSQI